MGKVFWIACGIVLAGAIGLYAWTESVPRDEVRDLGQQVKARKKKLHGLAGKKLKEIKNPHFINEITECKEKLAGQEKLLKDLMRARDMDLSDEAFGGPVPRTSVAGFRLWLMDKYSKRNALLREKKIIFPDDGSKVDDVVDWETIGTDEIPRVLREYVISEEVFRALADAEAKVTYRYPEGKTEKLAETVVIEKVVELERLDLGVVRSGGRRRAAPSSEEARDRFTERSFALDFAAHFNVVLDVMRRLEGSKRALFVVREISIKRHEKARFVDVMEEMRKSVEPYLNTMTREAPVRVALQVGLLDYPDVRPEGKGAGGGP